LGKDGKVTHLVTSPQFETGKILSKEYNNPGGSLLVAQKFVVFLRVKKVKPVEIL